MHFSQKKVLRKLYCCNYLHCLQFLSYIGPSTSGIKGQKGLAGSPGDTGSPGISGKPGFDGVPGIKGANGDKGYYGLKGTQKHDTCYCSYVLCVTNQEKMEQLVIEEIKVTLESLDHLVLQEKMASVY